MIVIKDPKIQERVAFIIKRIREQRDYIKEIKHSQRSENRKLEIIKSANEVKLNLEIELGQMVEQGLIDLL